MSYRQSGAPSGLRLVSAETPYPEGPTNPFIVARNAWESNEPIERIGRSNVKIDMGDGLCPASPELVKLSTTTGWTDWDACKRRVADIMVMHVSADEARGQLRFPWDLSIGWPQSLVKNGSVNNDSPKLTIEGASWGYTNYFNYVSQGTFNVTLNVTFNGTFDGVNSTRALQIQPRNATLARASN
ncbi:uncharacterized protein LDX57_002815 [Aspergillus melleus]|uniref:uncharacterized protein n=1 Tax=Aspergillus melleus TaxID=138277 RepID=UPI001E8DDD0B|nr:uncharacterized protein LDX57_002815 [Aspergillus melleus]KAH8425066.1 hypothetical protein LDX57_002815 [Aspergillus melleus]